VFTCLRVYVFTASLSVGQRQNVNVHIAYCILYMVYKEIRNKEV
jgi:hypothetical protein